MLGLAKVRKTPPKLKLGQCAPVADDKTLEAIIANRYEVMAKYATELRRACAAELARMKAQGAHSSAHWKSMRLPSAGCTATTTRSRTARSRRWPRPWRDSPVLGKLVAMREELRLLWTRTNVSAEQLVADLQAWCKKAEESGIAALQEFSLKLRAGARLTLVPQRGRCVSRGQRQEARGPRRGLSLRRRRPMPAVTSAWFPCTARACAPSGRTS